MTVATDSRIADLKTTIATLEGQRTLLGDSVVTAALAPLLQQLAELETPAPSASEGERKLVTVMFADISGFTALSEKLDPEQVRNLMNSCFDALVPAIEKYHGTIDKFIGDAVLALFGAPMAYENHAERALRAALEMLEALHHFNEQNRTALGIHFGINTGLVIAGGIGSQGQQQYSVMGDAVNLAARLEDASETGQILVGQNTYRLTAPLFVFEMLPPIKVKGKAEPVSIYQLVGLKSTPGTLRGIEGLRSPLIGRESEMAQFQALFKALEQGHGHIISVIGEAGLGKSRLITEASRSFQPSATWIEGRCLSYAENMSYHVASDILYHLIGANNELSAQEVAAALHSTVERLFQEQTPEVYPYLARLLNLPLDTTNEERVKYLSAEALRGRILSAYAMYVRARALEYPLILVWEDLHWSDPSSLAILEKLLPLTDEIPLMLIILFRPEAGQATDFHQQHLSQHTTLEIQPLSDALSIKLLNHLLHIENLPETVYRMILEKAEGNAFFLEEVLRSLIDTGLILIQQENTVVSPEINNLSAIDIPDTLQGVIAARIDRLPADHKHTLQTASVIGRVFQEQVLAYLFDQETLSETLRETLGRLREREFIRLKAEMEYIFKHAVTQDVAYGSLLISRRRELHKVTAQAIETLFPHNLDELSATLAYHYQHAEIPVKAVEYLIQAADRAKGTYANAEAITFYRAAIEQMSLLEGDQAELRGQLRENLGDVLHLIGQHEESRRIFEAAIQESDDSNPGLKARLYRKLARTWEVQRSYQEALTVYQQAEAHLHISKENPDLTVWQAWIDIQLDLIRLYYWLLNQDAIARTVEQIQAVIDTYGLPAQQANFFTGVALARLQRERYVPTTETFALTRKAAEASQSLTNLAEVAWIQFGLGFVLLWRGDLEEAERQLHVTLELTERIGDITTQSRCLTYLTITYRKQRRIQNVREYVERSLVVSKAGQMIEYVGMAYANLAWADWREGRLEQARHNAQLALEGLKTTKGIPQITMFPWVVYCPLLGISVAQNQLEEAIQYTQLITPSVGNPLPDEVHHLCQNAVQAWEGGEAETARGYLEKAIEQGRATGHF